jgi:hypothetical protein
MNAARKAPPGRPSGFLLRGSLTDQISSIEVGQTVTRSTRIPIADVTRELVAEEHKSLANSLGSSVYRVQRDTGKVFSIERGELLLASGDMLIVAVVTRTK